MPDNLLPYALTTLQRVKDRLFDTRGSASSTGSAGTIMFEIPGGTIDNSNVVFTPVNTPSFVIVNGNTYFPGQGYSILSGNIVLLAAVGVGGTIQSGYIKAFAGTPSTYQPTTFDDVLIRMINGFTDWTERECGGRRFALTIHPNQIYSAAAHRQTRVMTRQAPIVFETITANTVAGSSVLSAVSSTTAMVVGMPISADNIQQGPTPTTVTAINGASVTISRPANTTVNGGYVQFNGLLSFQFRAGPPSNPNWTPFITDQYELVNDGKAGVIRIYGSLPSVYSNMARISYVAGYAIDWPNAGNNTTHKLPADLSNMVENVVVRAFKRRQLAGKTSEALDGATTAWNKEIDSDDQAVIGHYRRMPTIF